MACLCNLTARCQLLLLHVQDQQHLAAHCPDVNSRQQRIISSLSACRSRRTHRTGSSKVRYKQKACHLLVRKVDHGTWSNPCLTRCCARLSPGRKESMALLCSESTIEPTGSTSTAAAQRYRRTGSRAA